MMITVYSEILLTLVLKSLLYRSVDVSYNHLMAFLSPFVNLTSSLFVLPREKNLPLMDEILINM